MYLKCNSNTRKIPNTKLLQNTANYLYFQNKTNGHRHCKFVKKLSPCAQIDAHVTNVKCIKLSLLTEHCEMLSKFVLILRVSSVQ